MIWNKEMECMDRASMRELQLKKLRETVKYCYENSEFYHKRLTEAGVGPDSIKSLKDIERIPFTTKDDIAGCYPFGMFCKPMKEIVRLHASSGTTGKPKVVGYTRSDMEMWTECCARMVTAAGATDEDVAQISFGYGLFTGALGLHQGLERIGATVIPVSSGNTERQLMLMQDFGVTLLVATPSYAVYLSEAAKESGLKPGDLKLKLGLFGAEGSTEEMRRTIEQNLGVFATDNYGMTELNGPGVSGECQERCGMHFSEDFYFPEIIDPETGETRPEGEHGELVVTTLGKEGFPMLRYRTRDLTRLDYAPCRCGRTGVRMEKVRGRSDDMLIIKGVNVFPSQIESIVVGIEHLGPHYQLVVRRERHMDTLEVQVELIDGGLLERYSELERVERLVKHRLTSVLGIDAKVRLVEPKSLERYQGKAKRVLDLRGQ